jgi:hypothetical protein
LARAGARGGGRPALGPGPWDWGWVDSDAEGEGGLSGDSSQSYA